MTQGPPAPISATARLLDLAAAATAALDAADRAADRDRPLLLAAEAARFGRALATATRAAALRLHVVETELLWTAEWLRAEMEDRTCASGAPDDGEGCEHCHLERAVARLEAHARDPLGAYDVSARLEAGQRLAEALVRAAGEAEEALRGDDGAGAHAALDAIRTRLQAALFTWRAAPGSDHYPR